MSESPSDARRPIWASLWEDEPDPWWMLTLEGVVLAQNRAAGAVGGPPTLSGEAWLKLRNVGVWRGEPGSSAAHIALLSGDHVTLVTPTPGLARGDPLRQALDTAASALIGVEDGRIAYRSAGARRWAGREILGEPPRSVLPPAVRSVLAGHGSVADMAADASGGLRRLNWRRLLLTTAAEDLALLVGIESTPAPPRPSEGPRAEEPQIASVRLTAIGEMAAGVAHELNQPLNVITGYIELLQDGGGGRDDIARALEVMSRAAERMATLVNHLRDYTRAGLETLRPVDLREVVRHADELSSRAARPPVPLAWVPTADPLYVLGDPGRLEQLFINLLANARQATATQGGRKIELRMYVSEGDGGASNSRRSNIVVEVQDQGPGVPTSLRERIFEPFFTTKGRQGTGLGLSICERITREHQGRIQIDDAPGGGALFRVTLPRYAPI